MQAIDLFAPSPSDDAAAGYSDQPPPPEAPTVRRLLVRMLLITQIPAIAAVCVLLAVDYQRQRRDAASETQARVAKLEIAVRDRVQGIQAVLKRLATVVPAEASGMKAFHEELSRGATEASVDSIVLLKASGEQVLDSSAPPDAALPHAPGGILGAVRSGQHVVNDLSFNQPAHGAVVSVTVPVVRDSHIVYGLDAIVEAGRIRDVLERQDLPPGWIGAVIDRHGKIIGRVPNHEWFVGKAVTPDLQAKIDAGGEGVFDTVTLDGVEVVTAYDKSPDLGWTMVVSVPRATLEAGLRRSAAYVAGVFLLLLALGLWSSARLRMRMVRAIESVRASALELPRLQPMQTRTLGVAEADDLARALRDSATVVRRATAALERSQQRLEAILQTARSAVIVCDADHRIVLFNAAAEAIFGRPRHEAIGAAARILFDPAGWDTCMQEVASLVACSGEARAPVKSATGTAVHADGSSFPTEFSISVLVDAGGERFYTLILRDITDRVRSEESLVAAHLEVERVTQGFHSALMSEIDMRQGQLARELHDAVGSSLAGTMLLLGSAQAMAREPRMAAMLQTASRHVQETAERIRAIARGVMPAGTDAGLFIEALEMYAQDLNKPGSLECTLNTRGDFADLRPETATHLYRIIQEAVANAVRHGAARVIRIRVARSGRHCRLAVLDDGTGFDLARVVGRHSGLGLKSMQARARAIGGELRLRRRPVGGCSVRVSWEAQAADTEEAQAAGGGS
jgi:PAS domain S-box-containing protein